MFIFFLLLVQIVVGEDLLICKEGEYRYEFTECDSAGGRWRVAVPRKPTQCQVVGLPSVRQKDCSSACESGQYLDVNSPEQSCKACSAGTYSLGGAVTFSNWTTFPAGFDTQAFDLSQSKWKKERANCTNSVWKAAGNHLESGIDACTSELTYAVTLKKEGSVTFSYQNPNDNLFFKVFVRNEQCMMGPSAKSWNYPTLTRNFEWKNVTMELNRGHNLIVWETSGYPGYGTTTAAEKEPVVIKYIEVNGVAYTSECTSCPAGTYSNTPGSKNCITCLADHYSSEKAKECKKCDTTAQYSRPGSAVCIEKRPCTVNDYIETHSSCDENNKFKKMFQWIEPKICRDDVSGSTSLPVSGTMEDCPPCNPGMFQNGTTCEFCAPMTYGDGKECKSCPASTEPEYGFDFHWWRTWPPNMARFCQSSLGRGCASQEGFQLHGNYMDSGSGHGDDARLLLLLETDGFKHNTLHAGQGTVSFEFETECEGPCSLDFHVVRSQNGKDQFETLKSWQGKQRKQKFVILVSGENVHGFYWVFKRDSNFKYQGDSDDENYKYRNDKLKIYDIKVTNTVDGGAALCKECPVGRKDEGCIPCPFANRIVTGSDGTTKCEPCPANTYLNVTNPYGKEACVPCGVGLHSAEASTQCISSCKYTSVEGKSYDFTSLSGFHTVQTSALFTSKGTKYYHQFNITMCPSDTKVQASCKSNVTGQSDYSSLSRNASVCRLTIIPHTSSGDAWAAQPISVADQLTSIKTHTVTPKHEILGDEGIKNETVVAFHYQAHDITEACPSGRSTVVYLVCAPHHKELKTRVPIKCSEGTCDGCSFHFVIHSSFACPLCTPHDYEKVVTGCVKGKKNTTSVWKTPRICERGVPLPARNSTACSILERSVQDFVLGLGIFAGFVLLMILAVFVLWYKNRRLEYKYHKLIQNASDRSGEMPAAPQCVADDDEDEDDEEVHFKGKGGDGRGKRFFRNLKDKFGGGDVKLSEQYSFNNFSDDENIGSIEPTAKTPLS